MSRPWPPEAEGTRRTARRVAAAIIAFSVVAAATDIALLSTAHTNKLNQGDVIILAGLVVVSLAMSWYYYRTMKLNAINKAKARELPSHHDTARSSRLTFPLGQPTHWACRAARPRTREMACSWR